MLIDSTTDESEVNSPIKAPQHEGCNEVVYLSKTQKRTMRSKMVIDMINDMKMKLGSKVALKKAGKTKIDSEISVRVVNSTKRKRVEEVMDMGQCDDRLPGTDTKLTDVTMVPPILIAGLRSASYQTKWSDRTLTGATLEREITSHCGKVPYEILDHLARTMERVSVVGQLIPVEYDRLTASENVSIDKPGGAYMEMVEY